MTFTAIDCQGFAGGFTLGVVQSGFKLIGKREMTGGFGVANCEANRHLLGNTWQSEAVPPEQWSAPYANLVFGNPPCSGFSVLSSKTFRGVGSKINHCMWAFAEYAARVRPQIAIFESVPLAFTQGHSLMTALFERLRERVPGPWKLYHVLHNAYSVGGPAQRRRYFWVASRIPLGVEVPRMERYPTLRDTIGDLISTSEGSWGPVFYQSTPTWYSRRFRIDRFEPEDVVDGHVAIDNPNTRRTRDLLQVDSECWLPGDHAQRVTRRFYEKHGSLPISWRHLEEKLKERDFFMGYNTPTMWRPDEAARVITGAGMLNGVHWEAQRTFTHRETARIMGFPDQWLIEPLMNVPGLFMTWGKGITVDCGRWIADWAQTALNGDPGHYTGIEIGDSQYLIDVTNAWRGVGDTVTGYTRNILRKLNVPARTEKPVTEAPLFQAPESAKVVPRVDFARPTNSTPK